MAKGKQQDVPQVTILNEKHDEWSEKCLEREVQRLSRRAERKHRTEKENISPNKSFTAQQRHQQQLPQQLQLPSSQHS